MDEMMDEDPKEQPKPESNPEKREREREILEAHQRSWDEIPTGPLVKREDK